MKFPTLFACVLVLACKPSEDLSSTKAHGPTAGDARTGLFLIDGTGDDEPSGTLGAIYLAYDGIKFYKAGIPTEMDQRVDEVTEEVYVRMRDKKLFSTPIDSISTLAKKVGVAIPEALKGAFAYQANVAKDEVVSVICAKLSSGQIDRVALMGYSRGAIQALGAVHDIVLNRKCKRKPDFITLVLVDAVNTMMGPSWSLKVPEEVAALHIVKDKASMGIYGQQNPLFWTAKITGQSLKEVELTKELAKTAKSPDHERVSAHPFVGEAVLQFLSDKGVSINLNFNDVLDKARERNRSK